MYTIIYIPKEKIVHLFIKNVLNIQIVCINNKLCIVQTIMHRYAKLNFLYDNSQIIKTIELRTMLCFFLFIICIVRWLKKKTIKL